jgi:hypothetical protein
MKIRRFSLPTFALIPGAAAVCPGCSAAPGSASGSPEAWASTAEALTPQAVVDDDGAQCPDAQFTDIQSAVDAAPSGAAILVCAGMYTAPLDITKSVTLLGAQHGVDARSRTSPASAESLIVSGAPEVVVDADDVVLDGFSFEVVLDLTDEGVGVRSTNTHSGYKFLNNICNVNPTTLLWIGSSGARQTLVKHNHFTNGYGVAADDIGDGNTIMRNVLVEYNLFDASSMSVSGLQHSDIDVTTNKFTGGGGIGVSTTLVDGSPGITNVDITSNDFGGGGGVYVSKVSGAQITYNRLKGAPGSGDGIVVDGANEAVSVASNTIRGFAGSGVQLGRATGSNLQPSTTGVTVTGNSISHCNTGIGLFAAQGNVVSTNSIAYGIAYGIKVDGTSSGNTFVQNTVQGSSELDCEDLSVGSGTSGTADTWTANTGTSSSPAGLCSP